MIKRFIRNISLWNLSEVIIDRKSRFQGRCVSIKHENEISGILEELLKTNKQLTRASHPHIYAWRSKIVDKNDDVGKFVQGFNDNGESGAGIKLLEQALVQNNVENVLVIVTRWMDGNSIGPSRFRHIVNCGLDSLRIGGYVESKQKNKKKKG